MHFDSKNIYNLQIQYEYVENGCFVKTYLVHVVTSWNILFTDKIGHVYEH